MEDTGCIFEASTLLILKGYEVQHVEDPRGAVPENKNFNVPGIQGGNSSFIFVTEDQRTGVLEDTWIMTFCCAYIRICSILWLCAVHGPFAVLYYKKYPFAGFSGLKKFRSAYFNYYLYFFNLSFIFRAQYLPAGHGMMFVIGFLWSILRIYPPFLSL